MQIYSQVFLLSHLPRSNNGEIPKADPVEEGLEISGLTVAVLLPFLVSCHGRRVLFLVVHVMNIKLCLSG